MGSFGPASSATPTTHPPAKTRAPATPPGHRAAADIDPRLPAARAGDPAAQAALLRSMQDRWFRYCLAQLGDSHAAEDATQETALRVLRMLPGFRGRSSFSTWSFGVALNVCREARRRRRPTAPLPDHDPPAPGLGPAHAPPTPDDAALTIHRLLASISPRQREAVVLRYLERLPVRDTARAMRCSEGTVKTLVHRGLKAMRAASAEVTP